MASAATRAEEPSVRTGMERPTALLPLTHLIRISLYWLGLTAIDGAVGRFVQDRLNFGDLVAPTQIGSIQLNTFVNPAGLESRGEYLYVETGASGTANANTPGTNGAGALMQGYVETSNVNVVEEMVNMIETQRAYEVNSKAISTSDQMLKFINNNL